MGSAYRVNFTIYPKGEYGYKPITISCRLSEYQAKVIMATPVLNIGVSVERAGGMVIDATPEPVDFNRQG